MRHAFRPDAETLDGYLWQFRGARAKHAAMGEASTHYLRSRTALREILEFNSDARIIVLLRNPIEQLRSWHSHTVTYAYEDVDDLQTAWDLHDARRAGRDPSGCRCENPEFLQYRQIVSLSTQLR